jgi:hypothetical protein
MQVRKSTANPRADKISSDTGGPFGRLSLNAKAFVIVTSAFFAVLLLMDLLSSI